MIGESAYIMKKLFRNFHFHIKKWFFIYFTCLALTMLILVAYMSLYALRVIRSEAYHSIAISISTQVSQFNTDLHKTETYLSGFVYDDTDVANLDQDGWNDLEWMKSVYHLQETFSTALKVQLADNFFYYSPAPDLFVTGSNPVSTSLRQLIKDSAVSDDYFVKPKAGKWNIIKADGKYYLIRILNLRNGYVGAFLSIDSAISTFESDSQDLYLDFALSDGTLLRTSPVTMQLNDFQKIIQPEYDVIKINGQSELFLSSPLAKSDSVRLVAMVPDRSVSTSMNLFRTISIIVLLFGCMLLILSFMLGKRIILYPIEAISSAIGKIRNGQTETRIQTGFRSDEYNEMGTAFNEMMDEIRQLQISVYEEQLHKQQVEIEVLKLQVTPHFLVNCLNTVYQLTEAGHPDLSLQMIKDLTAHLRYLLSCGTTVSLKSELEMTANYIDLSSIRYPGCIRLTTDYDPAADSCRVIPLMVLNFAENIVKHEIEMGHLTEIQICTKLTEDHLLYICISDNGNGYSPEILQKLQNMDAFSKEHSLHIGISNVYARAKLILGDGCRFVFHNQNDTGGAVTEIYIPTDETAGPPAFADRVL